VHARELLVRYDGVFARALVRQLKGMPVSPPAHDPLERFAMAIHRLGAWISKNV
jgi:hypothetical protein